MFRGAIVAPSADIAMKRQTDLIVAQAMDFQQTEADYLANLLLAT
jgi:hypothetical protein